MSKIAHLLEMILTLQYKQFATASELSEILEVDKKTIYRYIDTLNMANIPINTKKGRYGGFYIDEDFYLKEPNLDAKELQSVLMASEILTEESGFIYENDLKRAATKIKNISLYNNPKLKDLKPNIDFKISNIGSLEKLDDKISKINLAISRGRTLKLSYFSMNKNDITKREVDPYTLVFRQGAWYLIAYCNLREEVRIFKVSRIKELSITEHIFIKPVHFSVSEYLKNSWGIFRGEQTLVKIKFSKKVANFIKETKWHDSQHVEKLLDGSIIFSVYVNGLGEIKKWIMGFGASAEVIEPPNLRKEISEEICDLYRTYRK